MSKSRQHKKPDWRTLRSIVNEGIEAGEDEDWLEVAKIAEDLAKVPYHNPFWVSIAAFAIGNLLRKAAWSPIRRLGWSLIGLSAANSAKEAVDWSLDVAERAGNVRKQFGGQRQPSTTNGGIGQP